MTMRTLAAAAALALAGCDGLDPAPTPEERPAQIEVLARYPAGTFLENLAVAPDGAVYFTNYTARTIEVWRSGGGARTLATLPAHPVSIAVMPDGVLAVVAHARSFFEGPVFLGTGRVYQLGPQGEILAEHPASQAQFLNGVVALDAQSLLIADSAMGAIWRYDLPSGQLTPWFAATELAPQAEPFLPGANGLKLGAGALYISSSARRTIFRLPMEARAPAGPMTVAAADLLGADDFQLLPGGDLLVATHGEAVVRIAPDGSMTIVTDHKLARGSTAVATLGSGANRRALALGTGGVTEGGKDEAALIAVPLP